MILATLFRFLILALPLVLLTLGLFHFDAEAIDLIQPGGLSAPQLLGRWLLEATGLVALYMLVRERGLGRWLAGVAAGWSAWIFRGPVLVLTVAGASRLSSSAWWHLNLAWFGLYTVCGLMMASVARSLEVGEEVQEAAETPEVSEAQETPEETPPEMPSEAGPAPEREPAPDETPSP